MAQTPDGNPWPLDGRLAHQTGPAAPFAAYVHVPFCSKRCGYCDFNTYTTGFGPGADLDTYAQSVIAEVALAQNVLESAGVGPRPLRSVFFGGGTPSLLSPDSIGAIMGALRTSFTIADGAEVTLEANPDTVDATYLRDLRALGVTRVSFGMQSAVPEILAELDRTHDAASVPVAVAAAKDAGLSTSVDLIYGSPSETLEQWEATLRAAIALETDHISAYSLIVEPGARMHSLIARSLLAPVDESLSADKYVVADELLSAHGFDWYEISNFARTPADRSTHNLAYWRDWDWWGFGPGAHSHQGSQRFWNVKHPRAYAQRIAAGVSPAIAGEDLSDEDRQTERVMLGIRTREGLAAADLDKERVERAIDDGHLVREGDRVVLTLSGRLFADAVTRTLLGW